MRENKTKSIKGRGAASQPDPRYMQQSRQRDIEDCDQQRSERLQTTVTAERAKSIIATNTSPDIPFDKSINPYRGCEHGCIYCYARPAHAYMDLSPGLDFESRLFYKVDAAALLERELDADSYRCSPIAIGGNTDAYQPIEREYRITRQILEVLARRQHPCSIVTKSSLVERDIDLLAPMAEQGLVRIFVSITTLDKRLMQKMEPRASSPQSRLQTLARLTEAGIPTGVMFAPVIPAINDSEMESVLEQSAAAGAESAGYVLLRLPHEIKQLFREWLALHFPLKAAHVMSLVQQSRNGRDYVADFHTRLTGQGVFADMIQKRFQQACKRFRLNVGEHSDLDTSRFIKAVRQGQQFALFED